MEKIKELIEEIVRLTADITLTAGNVNQVSHQRKDLANEGISLVADIITTNQSLTDNFKTIYNNAQQFDQILQSNSAEIREDVNKMDKVIEVIQQSKKNLGNLNSQIDELIKLVDQIKIYTDEIFSLAMSASIAASKYTHTSKVFDILSDKLNEMSNFIGQNLENVTSVINPINDGILSLVNNNNSVLEEVTSGHDSLHKFIKVFEVQQNSIAELISRSNETRMLIEERKRKFDTINSQVEQMSTDAESAITGSGNVQKTAENLNHLSEQTATDFLDGKNNLDNLNEILSQSSEIWKNAEIVNQRSRNQLDFSLSSIDFCNSLIEESEKLREITENFNTQSTKNSRVAGALSSQLKTLNEELHQTENEINDSNNTILKFSQDYEQMDNVLLFLKNILRSMNVVGMHSRIESARDPEEFKSFMTISESIIELQDKIQDNLPLLESNIETAHQVITVVSQLFSNVTQAFKQITESSSSIINKLAEIISISSSSDLLSSELLARSGDIDTSLNSLRDKLQQLSDIVKTPIEGSAQNIERGKQIENNCNEIFSIIKAN